MSGKKAGKSKCFSFFKNQIQWFTNEARWAMTKIIADCFILGFSRNWTHRCFFLDYPMIDAQPVFWCFDVSIRCSFPIFFCTFPGGQGLRVVLVPWLPWKFRCNKGDIYHKGSIPIPYAHLHLTVKKNITKSWHVFFSNQDASNATQVPLRAFFQVSDPSILWSLWHDVLSHGSMK